MKIIGISGSPRKKNTYLMVKTICEATGKEYELISLGDKNISDCQDCRECHKSYECKVQDDMQEIYKKLLSADGIVLGSPTYFDNVSGLAKNFMDRCLPFYFSKKLENKKCALATVGNFHEYVELDEQGECKWHKEETESVKKCLATLKNFSEILGLNVIGGVYALHGSFEEKKEELIGLGKKLV